MVTKDSNGSDFTTVNGCHAPNVVGCSNAISGQLTIRYGTTLLNTFTLTAASASTTLRESYPGGPQPTSANYWSFSPAPDISAYNGTFNLTYTATFLLNSTAATSVSVFVPGSSYPPDVDQLGSGQSLSAAGSWAFLESNNWGTAAPFNFGVSGKLKPGEDYRNSVLYQLGTSYCLICGVLQFAGFVVNAIYTVVNSTVPGGSPGWGWSMGPSYAKIVE